MRAANLPTNANSLRALAWLEKGWTQASIGCDEVAPKKTAAELAVFDKCAYRRVTVAPASMNDSGSFRLQCNVGVRALLISCSM
jgi:hypothetical protein